MHLKQLYKICAYSSSDEGDARLCFLVLEVGQGGTDVEWKKGEIGEDHTADQTRLTVHPISIHVHACTRA